MQARSSDDRHAMEDDSSTGPRPALHEGAGDTFRPFDRIVVPVSGSARELDVQRRAVRMAADHDVPIHAVHVRDGAPLPPVDLFGYLETLCDRHGVDLDAHVLEGEVVDSLARELGPRDLVVVGTERMAASSTRPSVAAGLIRQAPCPVQTVRIG